MGDEEHEPKALPATLRIDFGIGERPERFWVSRWTGAHPRARYKVLSKRRADRAIEVLVLEERARGRTRAVRHEEIPADAPSGLLEHWVTRLARDVGLEFESYDLTPIASIDEWRRAARELGWLDAAP